MEKASKGDEQAKDVLLEALRRFMMDYQVKAVVEEKGAN
jgi:hypothetical protein